MKATAFEYRLRFVIHLLLCVLGFSTPWNYWLHLDTVRTWQWLAAWMFRSKIASFNTATVGVLVVGIVLSLLAAIIRTWGAAYMGAGVVKDGGMHGQRMVASGPYRYVRNPLYIGTMFNFAAISLLMLPSGALFTLVLAAIFQVRLILAEEPFLAAKLGDSYREYCAKVPRLIPSLTPRVADSGTRPAWGAAALGELYMWGTAVSFAAFGWGYNSMLILQGVVVSLGLSIVAKAFVPQAPQS